MAKEFSVSDNSKEVAEVLRAQLSTMQNRLKEQVFKALTLLEAQILQNIRKDSGLQVRSGKLLNSIGKSKKVTVTGAGEITGEIGPKGVPYAAIHEFGGTIFPVKAKALTIPTEENRRADGQPKIPVDRLKDAFIAKGMIFQKIGKGKNAQITPMFILRSSVKIPARPYLAPALAAKKEEILKDFGVFLSMSFRAKGE